MQERRRFMRWQINRQAKFRLEQAVQEAFCQIKDINYKGAQIVINTKLPEDVAFRLNLKLSQECSFEAEVWVAWRKVISGVNHYGLYFSKIKDADKNKIYDFVYTFFPNDLHKERLAGQYPAKVKEVTVDIKNAEGATEKIDDQRIFERFPVRYPVRILNLDNGNESAGQTVDISAKGLGLTCDQELSLRTPLEIWLQVPHKGEPLYLRGEVAWSKAVGSVNYHFGVGLEKAELMGISRFLRP